MNRLVKAEDDDNDPDKKNNIVFNATSEFCRTLGDIPTYGLSGNREDQEDIMVHTIPTLVFFTHLGYIVSLAGIECVCFVSIIQDFEKDNEKEGGGQSDSDMDDNVGWSTVNLDEEKNQADVSLVLTSLITPQLDCETFTST